MTPAESKSRLRPVLIGAIIIVGALMLNPFYTVHSGDAGVVMNFGSVQPHPALPGLHFRTPLYQSIATISVQPQTVQSEEMASTHDLQNVHTTVAVTFHVPIEAAPEFYRSFRSFDVVAGRIINPTVSNDVKAITARYDAEELVTKREVVSLQIRDLIAKNLVPYHLAVEAVNISNFKFSHGYDEAIESKQVAQQQALQAQYTLQQTQISAQQQVVQAKAAADAAIASANGEAQALLTKAQAQAKANELLSQSLTPAVLQAKALDRWNGIMPTYLGSSAPLPFVGAK